MKNENSQIVNLAVEQVQPDPNQPRREFPRPELENLGKSMSKHEQYVPIVVYKEGDQFQIVDGERRWRAAKMTGLKTIRANVLDKKPSNSDLSVTQIIINSQRLDLTALEQFSAYSELMKSQKLNATELAELLNISKSKVTRILSLGKLTQEESMLVANGQLSSANAYSLTRLSGTKREQAFEAAANGHLNREQLELTASQQVVDRKSLKRISFELPAFTTSLVAETKPNLGEIIETLHTLIKECKKAHSQGLDVATLVCLLRDRTKTAKGIN